MAGPATVRRIDGARRKQHALVDPAHTQLRDRAMGKNDVVEQRLTTRQVAELFQVDPRTISDHARRLGLGIDFGGRAGKRFSEADIQALEEDLRPPPLDFD